MYSITHVAREADVAVSTVSLAMNRPDRVSKATRRKIQEAIIRLGYRPRQAKRKCHVAAVYSRGLFIHDVLVEYCQQWIAGIKDAFAQQGAMMSIFQVERSIGEDPVFQKNLREKEFDGMLAMGLREDRGYVETALELGIPVVSLDRRPIHTEFSSVAMDHYGAGRLVAEHLIECGHRRIAIDFLDPNRRMTREIRGGFLDVMRRHNLLEPLDLVMPELLADKAAFVREAQRMLDAGVTACFCGTSAAAALGDELIRRGMRIPEQMSLVGLENLGFEISTGQQITCVDYNARAVGLMGGQLLQQLLNMRGELKHLEATVPARLVHGQTVAPPSN
jgi:LacI family transcriptional regulator